MPFFVKQSDWNTHEVSFLQSSPSSDLNLLWLVGFELYYAFSLSKRLSQR